MTVAILGCLMSCHKHDNPSITSFCPTGLECSISVVSHVLLVCCCYKTTQIQRGSRQAATNTVG